MCMFRYGFARASGRECQGDCPRGTGSGRYRSATDVCNQVFDSQVTDVDRDIHRLCMMSCNQDICLRGMKPSPGRHGTAIPGSKFFPCLSSPVPKPDRLQRLPPFNVISQCAAHLRHKSTLILRITEGSRSELGGS